MGLKYVKLGKHNFVGKNNFKMSSSNLEIKKKVRLMQRKFSTKLKLVKSQDVSILDSSLFDNQLKSMDEACSEVTDSIDEMIDDLEEDDDDDNMELISNLDIEKDKAIKTLNESKTEFLSKRKNGTQDVQESIQTKKDINNQESKIDLDVPDIGNISLSKSSAPKKNSVQKLGESVGKKGFKRVIKSEEVASSAGEGLSELATEDPGEVVLELVLGSIGEQLGVDGTGGFLAAALTHYAICQFAVLVGILTTPVKMDFSGITQAKIMKKLEDLNKKVDKLVNAPRRQALDYLKEGITELELKPIDFKEAKKKFEKVQEFAKNAIAIEDDFTNIAVCTKYLLFAETMVQSFTEEFTEGERTYGECFVPIEKLSERKKARMFTYLTKQVKELKKQMATKGKKAEDHRDKVDDILKMVYNIISICTDLSNPNQPIQNVVTFGIDTDYIPYGEEDATVLQVGRDFKEAKCLPNDMTQKSLKQIPGYMVYIWMKDAKKLCVRRNLKVFEIPKQLVPGNVVWVQLEDLEDGMVTCKFGRNKDKFERTAESRNGYPTNIQKMETLFEQVKVAKDLDALPSPVYVMMQRISDVYLADLGINVNDKIDKGKTLLHQLACLKPGWTAKLTLIDCLVDAGADLSSQDDDGRTPLMDAIHSGSEKNIRKMIVLCDGTPALNVIDNKKNNVLHLVACGKETAFTKEIVKVLLKANVNANQVNSEDMNPRDTAKYHRNFKFEKYLDDWLTGNGK